jgi:hypothetical protein
MMPGTTLRQIYEITKDIFLHHDGKSPSQCIKNAFRRNMKYFSHPSTQYEEIMQALIKYDMQPHSHITLNDFPLYGLQNDL